MKKRLFMFATAALMLAACSNDGEVAVNDAALQSGSGAVAFDTYVSATHAAYSSGVMTTAQLGDPGFGVFAYQNTGSYSYSVGPNFMYDQKVYTDVAGAWKYEPLKYWPNETGKDMHGVGNYATSTETDVLSFFAYAPWVASTTSTTAGTDPGINAMYGNDVTTRNPWIQYTVSTVPKNSVDLVWGVAPAGGLSYTAVNGEDIVVAQGKPLMNLVKPAKDQKIKFLFQHALARVGMTVVAAVDQIAPGGTLNATETKVFVNSVTLADAAATATIPSYGKLILYNSKAGVANWSDVNTDTRFSVTINGANLNEDLTTGHNGVTTSEKKVIAQFDSKDQYLMLIPTPGTDAEFNVTIDYDVVTTDAALNGGQSSVKNVITKKVTLSAASTFDPTVTGFVNNKAYNLKLILGLTSVKLEAEVADWEVDGSTNVDLPRNEEE